jgi:hypothetical protein
MEKQLIYHTDIVVSEARFLSAFTLHNFGGVIPYTKENPSKWVPELEAARALRGRVRDAGPPASRCPRRDRSLSSPVGLGPQIQTRQCVGRTSTRRLVSAFIQPPTNCRHGKMRACCWPFSKTESSRSHSNGALEIGFQHQPFIGA